jgi:hypothetical protein
MSDPKLIATHVAVLAPVPDIHIDSGAKHGRHELVAFGSRDWEVFDRLEKLRKRMEVNVYIYASHLGGYERVASWGARYVGYVLRDAPDAKLYRPESTVTDGDNWLLFWRVTSTRTTVQPATVFRAGRHDRMACFFPYAVNSDTSMGSGKRCKSGVGTRKLGLEDGGTVQASAGEARDLVWS